MISITAQYPASEVEVGALLKHPDTPTRQWMTSMWETHALVSAILYVIHPEQHAAGLASLRQIMSEVTRVEEALGFWQLPFNALTCIFNRYTPPHRDPQGHPSMLDLLFNIGSNQEESRMNISGLGLSFRYRSGTTLAFSGFFFQHEACIGHSDRICIAYYMRVRVLERARVKIPGWRVWRDVVRMPVQSSTIQ